MAKSKAYKDPLLSQGKESVVSAYRALERELHIFQRLEHLRVRPIRPAVDTAIDMSEFEKDCANQGIRAEVFAPMAPDGGILRLTWFWFDGSQAPSVTVYLFDDWRSKTLNNPHEALALRVLAERTAIAVSKIRDTVRTYGTAEKRVYQNIETTYSDADMGL